MPAASGSSGNWWGGDFGAPTSSGSQNSIRYAFFPAARRLSIELSVHVTVYDTADHQISGVSQQQSADATLTFVSQLGLVRLADLRVVPSRAASAAAAETSTPAPAELIQPAPARAPERPEARAAPAQPGPISAPGAGQFEDVFLKIERLAALRDNGILSEEEFSDKKAELLSRL